MMKLGSETGSLMNHLMSRSTSPEPQVGDGATILMWSDRKAATVIRVTRCTVTVQEDTATRIDQNGMSESQEYRCEPNPAGKKWVFRRLNRGGYRCQGMSVRLGERDPYHDYSF